MTVPSIRLQQRDLVLLMELAEAGVLDLPTIAARHFTENRSVRACQARLRLFTMHGLVHSLALSVALDDGRRGRLPNMYRLSRRGAEVLSEATGVVLPRPAKRDPRPETLLHRLGVAKVELIVNDACALHGLARPRWIHEYDTVPQPKPTAPADERFVLYQRFPLPDGRKATCWPDASCLLMVPLGGGSAHPLIIYWEFDRSTERLAQVEAKLLGYQPLLARQVYRRHWPMDADPTVRVFFVCPSQARVGNIAGAIAGMAGAEAVRFATMDTLVPQRVLAEPIWQTVQGARLPILPPLPRSGS
jgi:hypothetical protein